VDNGVDIGVDNGVDGVDIWDALSSMTPSHSAPPHRAEALIADGILRQVKCDACTEVMRVLKCVWCMVTLCGFVRCIVDRCPVRRVYTHLIILPDHHYILMHYLTMH
jgi:hypothetical protein